MNRQFTLLGANDLIADGEVVDGFISAKAQALLFHLAVTGGTHSRDALATLFWGEMPSDRARKNLTKALSNLRQLVDDFLLIERQRITVQPADDDVIDAVEFAELVINGLESADILALRQAVKLYRGDFLSGFSVKDAAAFEDWMALQRDEYRERVLQALEALAGYCDAAGDHAAAIENARLMLRFDPWRESAHRLLMRLYAGTGQRHLAITQYETLCQLLADELELEPEPETTALFEQLQTQQRPTPHNLPHAATPFIGRKSELAHLITQLHDPDCRLLNVIGPGGIGKTRLCLAAAEQLARPDAALAHDYPFPDGIFFVPLTNINSANAIVPLIATTLGVSLQDSDDPRRLLIAYLQNKRLLLVLDNLEHLIDGAPLLVDALTQTPNVKILTASRSRLKLHGEHLLRLDMLDFSCPG